MNMVRRLLLMMFWCVGGSSVTGRNPFEARLRNATEMIKLLHQNKAPRALLVSKTRDRGMCKDRPQGIQCCPGQDWNCQPPNSICSCDQHCREVGDCCPDYEDTCGNFVVQEKQCSGIGTGRANGDPHYHSFDMKMVHFQGKCAYILAKNCRPDSNKLVDFKVVARNENRYGNMEMSWTKDIFIKYLDVKIEINKNRVLKLNNERVYPPFILPDGTRIEKSGNYISVSTFFGIQIFYDGDGNAEIKASCDWHGEVCGLLGNFNGDPDDDMIGSDGEKYDEKTAEAFGESWRHWDNSPGCQLTPDIPLPKSEMWGIWMLELKNRPNFDGLIPKCTDQQFNAAVRKCQVIQSERDKFAPCHAKVNPSTFFENCVWDQCATGGDPSVFCDSVASFGRACSDFGRPINWRSKYLCPARCPSNSHYEFCGPMCEKTCKEPNHDQLCPDDLKDKCIEGCYCNKGYLWDGLKCVKQKDCGCVYGESSFLISEKYLTENCKEECTCTGIGEKNCKNTNCLGDKVCVQDDNEDYQCKPKDIFGHSMHLGFKPVDPPTPPTTTVSTTLSTTTVSTTTTIKSTKKPRTKRPKPQRDGTIQHNPLGFGFEPVIPTGPEVVFPDCLPKYRWRTGIVKPDWIPPNACCGSKPYNDNEKSCCNNLVLYDEREEKCCRRFGTVVERASRCNPRLNPQKPEVPNSLNDTGNKPVTTESDPLLNAISVDLNFG